MNVRTLLAAPAVAFALLLVSGGPACAELRAGAAAPPFATEASLGGKEYRFELSEALAKGPVVLYFYPAAFTSGCTVEAHDFAGAIDAYRKLGATVIGVSGDGIKTLDRFSVSECRSKFPVASDGDHAISRAYDALLGLGPVAYSDRTSYVIARSGKIVYAYRSLDPALHVAKTLAALRTLVSAGASAAPASR